jgi:RNA polymerase sigma-70 factor (ECF subfamily)
VQAQSTAASLLSRIRDPADHAAWRAFDERYRLLLLRFCWSQGIPRTDAEDIVQQVFVNLARTLPQFVYDRQRGRFRDYLYRCVRNVISDWLKRPERGVIALASDIEQSLADTGADGSASRAVAAAWEEEWVAHHYRLALDTVRRTFEPENVAMFERMLAGARPTDLARERGCSEEAVFKVRQRIRGRMQELIALQIREEDEV